MVIKDVLEDAKVLLERRWARGHYTDGEGGYCLAGAINIAAGEMIDLNGAIVYAPHTVAVKRLALDARLHASECLPEPFESLPTFNDSPGTTLADVLGVLDKAIASC